MDALQISYLRTPLTQFFSNAAGWGKAFLDNCNNNAGWMEPETREILFNTARLAADGLVVEIGSYQGLSTAYMAAGRKLRATSGMQKMYCIDPFCDKDDTGGTNNRTDFYPIFIENMKRCQVDDMINPVVATSTEVVDLFNDQSIEVIFIDGDHTAEGVQSDFDHYFPKVMVGGIMMFHDAAFEGPAKLLSALDKDVRVQRVIAQNSMVGFLKVGI